MMTDKERFEELAYNVGISLDGEKAMMSSDDYDFLYNYALEQAERVQELENEYQVRQIEYLEEHIDRLEKENKRYREVIEKIKKTSDDYRDGHLLDIQDSFFVDEIIAIINNLEGEE